MASISVRFRDLRVADPGERAELLRAVDEVLTHGQILLGPEVDRFEREIASVCRRRYCVAVGSGTDALHLALRSLGIGPGDEVVTTPLSWIATLNAIHLCGARPVFVDVRDDLNIDPELIEPALTPRTRAIVPVHFTGRPCDMERILAVARRHGVSVVADAAQAFGAAIRGVPIGAFGDAVAFSFNPMKILCAYGEAGAVVTDDESAYRKLLALRYLGTVDRETCVYPSLNSKVDTVQAAMLLVRLKHVERILQRRIEVAQAYGAALAGVVRCPELALREGDRCVFFDYPILAERRDELKGHMERRGVEVRVKHPLLMPHHPAYRHLPPVRLPVAEGLVQRILSLPLHEKLSAGDVAYVAQSVGAFYAGGA